MTKPIHNVLKVVILHATILLVFILLAHVETNIVDKNFTVERVDYTVLSNFIKIINRSVIVMVANIVYIKRII